MVNIQELNFPTLQESIRAKWAPLLLEPIAGSDERLVIACAVASSSGYHIEVGNALSRLQCFYGEKAAAVELSIQIAIEALSQELSRRGLSALENGTTVMSGVHIGALRDGEGVSLKQIGRDWMSVSSSLYDLNIQDINLGQETLAQEAIKKRKASDRLPRLVFNYIERTDLYVAKFFSDEIITGKRKTSRVAHRPEIDFQGNKLIASFATLSANKVAPSVGLIKQRLWDLKTFREGSNVNRDREHELIVHKPAADDPQISDKQYDRLSSEFDGLLDQADRLSLRLRDFSSYQEIGQHLLRKEAA